MISNLLKEYAIDGPGDGETTSEPEAGKGGEGSEDQVPFSIEGSVKQEEDKRPRFKNIVAIVDLALLLYCSQVCVTDEIACTEGAGRQPPTRNGVFEGSSFPVLYDHISLFSKF